MTAARYTSRPLLFPDARAWGDIFVEIAPWVSANGPTPAGWAHPWRMPDSSSRAKRPPLADCPIGPFCSFRGGETYRAAYVRARPEVYEEVKRNTIHVSHDTMSFEVVIRGDGTALLTCQHGLIIGGVWLALIDANTIPNEATP